MAHKDLAGNVFASMDNDFSISSEEEELEIESSEIQHASELQNDLENSSVAQSDDLASNLSENFDEASVDEAVDEDDTNADDIEDDVEDESGDVSIGIDDNDAQSDAESGADDDEGDNASNLSGLFFCTFVPSLLHLFHLKSVHHVHLFCSSSMYSPVSDLFFFYSDTLQRLWLLNDSNCVN